MDFIGVFASGSYWWFFLVDFISNDLLVFYYDSRNMTVDLSHIDTNVNMSAWPSFHNGVATGLRTSNKAHVNMSFINTTHCFIEV